MRLLADFLQLTPQQVVTNNQMYFMDFKVGNSYMATDGAQVARSHRWLLVQPCMPGEF